MPRLYATAAWAKARKQALHDAEHQCQRCGCSLIGLGKLAQVHHRKALRQAPALALEPQNLRPLCGRCHTTVEMDERTRGFERGVEIDGNPTAPEHPWNRGGA